MPGPNKNFGEVGIDDLNNGILNRDGFSSVQEALNQRDFGGWVFVPPKTDGVRDDAWAEDGINPNDLQNIVGYGMNTQLTDEGNDHIIKIDTDDVYVGYLLVDQTTAGLDAIHHTGPGKNPVIERVDIHSGGIAGSSGGQSRYGLYLDNNTPWVRKTFVAGGQAGMHTTSSVERGYLEVQANGSSTTPNTGIEHNGRYCNVNFTANNVGGDGVVIGGLENHGSVHVRNNGGQGLVVSGEGSVLTVYEFGNSTSPQTEISGNANVLIGKFTNDITLTSSADNNVLIGPHFGTLTDNGTNNNTSLLI